VCWARGNFSGEPGHVHICFCESPLCGVPRRYEYIWSLCRCGWRYSTDFLSSRLYFGMCGVIEQVGSWRDGTIVFVSLALFWRVGTIEMVGGLYLNFYFL
jgi:hypothetical protein